MVKNNKIVSSLKPLNKVNTQKSLKKITDKSASNKIAAEKVKNFVEKPKTRSLTEQQKKQSLANIKYLRKLRKYKKRGRIRLCKRFIKFKNFKNQYKRRKYTRFLRRVYIYKRNVYNPLNSFKKRKKKFRKLNRKLGVRCTRQHIVKSILKRIKLLQKNIEFRMTQNRIEGKESKIAVVKLKKTTLTLKPKIYRNSSLKQPLKKVVSIKFN